MKIQNNPRKFNKQWIAFNKIMLHFKLGNKGIYAHPDFVMMDWKTWNDLKEKAEPKKIVYIDEASYLG